ncbi:FkbM family methyltransferase [Tropicibacter sp. R16_0]|uniref:FkbM family methyltransferase n=1 Tax=Tropicibacter sp. R16_0 TaxID=2821102 RepID=UPI001ADCDA29|nr:FkbM family methyltransferase [Tropicibacter sp. R16_0]MBO9449799.1 FkbM family methyltransferase [Tropicibacter sp. R16_0]
MADPKELARLRVLWDLLEPARKTRIVDVGANPINQAPYDGLRDADMVEVWAFEPQQSAYEALLKDERKGQHVLPVAVGQGGQETLYVCESSGFTSLLKPNPVFLDYLNRWHSDMEVVEEVAVQTTRLDDLDEIPEFDLLKIDVQGGEMAVFEHGRTKLKGATAVITEVAAIPLYQDQPLLDQQMRELREQGFDLHKFMHMKSVKTGRASQFGFSNRIRRRFHQNQFVDGDAVFVRGLLQLDQQPSEALKHLAILADAVFQSYDLGVQALTVLAERGVVQDRQVHDYIDNLPMVFKPEMAD